MGIFDLPTVPDVPKTSGGGGIFSLPGAGADTKTGGGIFGTGDSSAVAKAVGSLKTPAVNIPEGFDMTKTEQYTLTPKEITEKYGTATSISQAPKEGFWSKVGDFFNGAANAIFGETKADTQQRQNARSAVVQTNTDVVNNQPYLQIAKQLGVDQVVKPAIPAGIDESKLTPNVLQYYKDQAAANAVRNNWDVIMKTYPDLKLPDKVTGEQVDKALGVDPSSPLGKTEAVAGILGTAALTFGTGGIGDILEAVTAGGLKAAAPTLISLGKNVALFSALDAVTTPLREKIEQSGNIGDGGKALLYLAQQAGNILATHGAGKGVDKVVDVFAKHSIEGFQLPQEVNLSGADVQKILGVKGGLTETEFNQMADDLGWNEDQKNAVKNGATITIPARQIITTADRPWWGKVKDFFGFEPSSETTINTRKIGWGDESFKPNVGEDATPKEGELMSLAKQITVPKVETEGEFKAGEISKIAMRLQRGSVISLPETKTVRAPNIPKGMESLAVEAEKYKNVDDFIRSEASNSPDIQKQILDNFEFTDDNDLRETTRAIETYNKYRLNDVSKSDAYTKVQGSYGVKFVENVKDFNSLKEGKLTSLYNEVHGLDTNGKPIENTGHGNNSGGTIGSEQNSSGRGSDFRTRLASMAHGSDSEVPQGAFSNYDTNQPNDTSGSEEGQGKKLRAEKSISINEETPTVLKQFGFSNEFTTKLKDVHEKGGVKNIQINTIVNGHEGAIAAYDIKTGTLHINQSSINDSSIKDGSVINHEIDGHSWYSKLSDSDRKAFYENLKNNKGIIKEAWKSSDDADHIAYWQQTIEQIKAKIATNSSWEIADEMASFTGLIFNPVMSLDSFIDRSLNLNLIIDAVNKEMVRRGLAPIDLTAENTLAIMEHGAMIAENASNLPANDDSIITRYIADIQDGKLKFGEDSVKALAYPGETDLTLKTLEKLKGHTTVSKQFIEDLTNSGEIKQVERDLIRAVLTTEGDKVNVQEFADKVKAELLPLTVVSSEGGEGRYENVSLPSDLRGNVADYFEHIYESPIKTSAGAIHFADPDNGTENYFGHTRLEDLAKPTSEQKYPNHSPTAKQDYNSTRRVIEVQSDLFQKGNFEKEIGIPRGETPEQRAERMSTEGYTAAFLKNDAEQYAEVYKKGIERLGKLTQYSNPTAHFRMVREEIKQAAKAGKTALQFPTGETAMKIEGIGNSTLWALSEDPLRRLTPDTLKAGTEIVESRAFGDTENLGNKWIITDVLGDGKFKAVTKEKWNQAHLTDSKGLLNQETKDRLIRGLNSYKETFDISGKVDTNNPIYRFYEKDLGRYLKNNYDAKPVTDAQGVTWYEVPIKPEMASEPVTAFREKTKNIEQLRRMLDRETQSLNAAISNPEAHAMAYGENKIPIYQERIKDLKARIAEAKNPIFDTGDTLEDARASLNAALKRTGVKSAELPEPLSKVSVANTEVPLSEDLNIQGDQIAQRKEYLKDVLKDHPGKVLRQLIDKKEGGILDPKDITKYYHTDMARYVRLKAQQDKKLHIAESAFEGTVHADMFDDPDTQRDALEDYQDKRNELKQIYQDQKDFDEKIRHYKNSQKDEIALNKIADRAGSLLDIKIGDEANKSERAREKLRYIQAVEKYLKEKGRNRADSIKAITDFFHLSDSDRKGLIRINADFRTMTETAFQNLLKQIQGKAYDIEQKRIALMEIQATIEEKDLHKVENFREAMKMKKLENMSVSELNHFNELLAGFEQGDTFLGKRTIQTANLTSLGDIKTVREAKTHLAKEAGVPITSVVPVQPTWIDAFTSDISLQNKNPLYKVMVKNTTDALTASNERVHAVESIFQKLMTDARKSRPRGIIDRLIPTDELIYRFNELDPADQISLMKQMTPEEIRAAQFVDEYFEAARNYLMEIEALRKYVKYYIPRTHMGVLEYLKTNGKAVFSKEGFKGFLKEILDAEKLQKANFKIMDDKTGEVLPKQKFFKYSIEREGHLNPSKNVGKVFMDYVRTFEKMRELNQFVPKLDLYANLLTTEEKTQFGLIKNDTLNTFVKKWLNNKRGRIQNTGFGKGDFPDIAIRFAIAFTRLKDLGLNIPIALASNIGAQVSTYIGIGEKKYAIGIYRMNTKAGKAILHQYEPMVGKTMKENLRDVSKTLGQKTIQLVMTFFSPADRAAKGVWLLGSLTPEEFKTGKISPERQTQLRLDMGRYHMSEGTTSIYGSTAIGGAGRQYKGWALPIISTTTRNIKEIIRMIKNPVILKDTVTGEKMPGSENVFKSRAFRELLRTIILSTIVILLGYSEYQKLKKNKNRTFLENIAYNSYTEALSIVGALDPTRISTVRVLGLLTDLSTNLSNIAVSLGTGDLSGTGAAVKQLYNKDIRPSFLGTPNQSDNEKITASITKSTNTAQSNLDGLNAELTDTATTTWEKVKKLGVGTDEADALVQELSNDEYTAYGYAKGADSDYWIQMAKTVGPIVDKAAKAGFGSDEADALTENMSDDEYTSYKMIKNSLYGKEGPNKWDQQTFVQHVSNIAKGWGTDPFTAFDDLIHGDWKITELKNGQILVNRMPESASQAIRSAAAKNNSKWRLDHIVPLEVGGTNRASNLQLIETGDQYTEGTWAANSSVENMLGKALGDRRITGQEAREYIIRYKAGVGEILSPEFTVEYQKKYKGKPLTENEIQNLVK